MGIMLKIEENQLNILGVIVFAITIYFKSKRLHGYNRESYYLVNVAIKFRRKMKKLISKKICEEIPPKYQEIVTSIVIFLFASCITWTTWDISR